MGVLVTDVGSGPESRQAALALAERAVDYRLITSVFFTPDSLIVRAAEHLPEPSGKRVAAYLLRRHDPELDRRRVTRTFVPDAMAFMLRRLPIQPNLHHLVVNAVFDWIVALALPLRARVVMTTAGSALRTIRRAKRRGATTVLFVKCPRPSGEHALVAAEEERLGLRNAAPPKVSRLARRVDAEIAAADLVITNSEFTRRDLLASGARPEKVVAVTLGVDLEKFPPAIERRRRVSRVLYVGGVHARKGVIHLAEAVQRLREEGFECHVDAYGAVEPSYGTKLQPYVASGALRLHGFVAHQSLAPVYAAADVFVLPTLSDGFGLVVYEAMASRLPVVVTDRCGAPVEHDINGLVTPVGDAAAIADALRRLMTEPELAGRLAGAALETARASTWDAYREQLFALLQQLTDAPSTLVHATAEVS